MINLLSEPTLHAEDRGTTLTLWVCEPFDESYSFRNLLNGLTAVLERTRPVALTLPPEAPREDFIEGEMRWGPTVYSVYYERSLGFLDLTARSESDSRQLLATLHGDLSWVEE